MKPLQIGLLIVAGALGGAVVMRVAQRPHVPPPEPVAQVEPAAPPAAPVTPVTPPAAVAEPAAQPAPVVQSPPPPQVAAAPPVEAKPRPFVPHNDSRPAPPRKRETTSRYEPPHYPAAPPPQVARYEPPPPRPAAPPEPVKETPPPPPVRPEPEHVTPPPPPPAPEPSRVTLNAGLLIPVRLVDGLSSERNLPGDTFSATLDRELVVDGFVIAERGARVEGRVVASDRGGKVKGTAALAVELTRVHTSDGQVVPIQTDSFERHAEPSHDTDAAKVGAGAAVGAIIGAIAGGGKGAAIGAGVGGGAGAGDVLLTRGKPVALPSETRINFRLRTPVTLTEKRG